MENNGASKLPDDFSIVFDGWLTSDAHYVALFASYLSNKSNGYLKQLLKMSPDGDENSQDLELR